ncbi:MAG: carboxypeptidase-like regulatory domain-containing protein [Acidobacteria bacterium]|nr:carboxypeptidase-like regulatory domain-containing protein [Acidobacteriota bacterium]
MFDGPRRGGRRPRGMLLGLTVAFLVPHDGADGYRFLAYHRNQDVPTARDAQLWSSTHWGFDDSLAWVVADDPGWTAGWKGRYGVRIDAPFRSASEVLAPVAEALAVWSRIEGADIDWRVTGVHEGVQVGLDGRNAITVDPESGAAAYAIGWARSRHYITNDWLLEECDIALHPDTASGLGRSHLSILIHELGHCVGLDHAAVAPHSFWTAWRNGDRGGELAAWGAAPQMSYGKVPLNGLVLDDVIGASLLRPARGWLRNRGAIAGAITVEGEPASFASVWAIRTADGSREGGIGSFTDVEGRFLIEGLAPGVYLVRAGPRILTSAHFFAEDGRRHDTRDGLALDPVTVSPGRVAEGVAVDLRRGRVGPNRSGTEARATLPHRGPVPGSRAAWSRHHRAAARSAVGAPCPGLTVHAQPPEPAGRDRDGRDHLATSVTVELAREVAGVTLDLLDPYATLFWDDPPVSASRITAWRTEVLGGRVRHSFDIEWLQETANPPFDLSLRSQDLRIGFHGGPCSGSPLLICAAPGCQFVP